jgi:hypothetical protein
LEKWQENFELFREFKKDYTDPTTTSTPANTVGAAMSSDQAEESGSNNQGQGRA